MFVVVGGADWWRETVVVDQSGSVVSLFHGFASVFCWLPR